MNTQPLPPRPVCARAHLLLALCLALLSSTVFAQDDWKWKLAPGQQYRLQMTQATDSTVAYSSKTVKSSHQIEIDLLWTIGDALTEPAGWKTSQTVARIALRMNDSAGNTLQYNSAVDTKPLGAVKEIAAQVAPLLGAKYELSLDSRGQILSAAQTAGAAPAGDQPAAFSPETVSQFLKQPLLILPELKPAPGGKWTHSSELDGPLGKLKQTRTYQFEGLEKLAAAEAAKITQTALLEPLGPPAGKALLKQQDSRGTIWFSPELGRLLQAEQTQTLATERPYRETKITVTLSSTLRTSLVPVAPAP